MRRRRQANSVCTSLSYGSSYRSVCEGTMQSGNIAGTGSGGAFGWNAWHNVSKSSSANTLVSGGRSRDVWLKPSTSPHRKPSIYFHRRQQRKNNAAISSGTALSSSTFSSSAEELAASIPKECFLASTSLGLARPLFKVTNPSCNYFAMRIPLVKAGFQRIEDVSSPVDCNLLWGKSVPIRPQQRDSDARRLQLSQLLAMRRSTLADGANNADKSHEEQEEETLDEKTQLLLMQQQRARRLRHMRPQHSGQRINHFPAGHHNLGCKSGMSLNINAMEKEFPGEFQFVPETWSLPLEEGDMMERVAAAPKGTRYIWKPARGSCGRGIFIFTREELLSSSTSAVREELRNLKLRSEENPATAATPEPRKGNNSSSSSCGISVAQPFRKRSVVVQRYLEDPLLVNGRKCDLRLYVAVTSFDPLVVYLHEDGLVRFAAGQYNPDTDVAASVDGFGQNRNVFEAVSGGEAISSISPAGVDYRFGHLTNYSIGRKLEKEKQAALAAAAAAGDASSSPAGVTADFSVDAAAELELKWNLPRLNEALLDPTQTNFAHPNSPKHVQKLWDDIRSLITKTLLAGRRGILKEIAREAAINSKLSHDSYFELYGFDVMLDSHGAPSLIEVNTLPSLESSSAMDYDIKSNVATDLFNILQLELFDRSEAPFLESGIAVSPSAAVSPVAASVVGNCSVETQDSSPVGESKNYVWSMDAIREVKGKDTRPVLYHSNNNREKGRGLCEEKNAAILDDLVETIDTADTYSGGFRRIFPPAATVAACGSLSSPSLLESIAIRCSLGVECPPALQLEQALWKEMSLMSSSSLTTRGLEDVVSAETGGTEHGFPHTSVL